ncbi:uncharacterized protein LOC114517180 [Dendronephthya gigantea]|uniref:uncharacterized protein LOC114517180 n=1 Tax=Dendronephthya gigantea TaxID=151771 RepID=UPI00106D9CB4|nr:uncharacterized protein LOC114517180 [Dendronephthya gigantea]
MSYDDGKMLTVHCAIKGHRPSTPDDIQRCLQSAFPYPFDGLIFTPDKAYIFGRDPLMFKWQNEDDLHCDLQLNPTGDKSDSFDVFKCRWNATKSSWDALFVRYDKDAPDSVDIVAHLEKICQQPFTKDNLLSNLAQHRSVTNVTGISAGDRPTNSLSFDELFLKIEDLVKVGKVDKTVDSVTGLEMFIYDRSTASFSDPIVLLCRGLVLHPPSKTVVTRPFIKFLEHAGSRDPNEMVEATIKYDGSLGIAFLWDNDVLVTTKRRMDSKQAIWAKQWIKDHCNLSMFQAGYTYLFEIIYQNNTVIVNYFFEGLVLLAINDEKGHELPYNTMLHFARATGFFMVTPRITAPYSEVLWYCGGIRSNGGTISPNLPSFTSGALPVNKKRQEGWVVKFSDGSRQKIVYSWWKNTSKLAQLVHPQVVWLLLKHDKIKVAFENAPNHFYVEILRMVQAIRVNFLKTLLSVQRCLGTSNRYNKKRSRRAKRLKNKSVSETDVPKKGKLTIVIEDRLDRIASINNLFKLVSELKPYHDLISSSNTNRSPFYNQLKLNSLRLPILNYIYPKSFVLEGYEPCDNFKQTWCKGWQDLSMDVHQWQFVQTALQRNKRLPNFLQLPAEIVVMILNLLDHASLASMAKVCAYLRQIIKPCRARLLHKTVLRPAIVIRSLPAEKWQERNRSTYASDNDDDVYLSDDEWRHPYEGRHYEP